LSWLIPFLQFFFNKIPFFVDKVLLAKDQFVTASIVTMVLSLLVLLAYSVEPYISITLNFWVLKKYREYLKKISSTKSEKTRLKIPPVDPPKTLNARSIAKYLIFILIVFVILFLYLGSRYQGLSPMPFEPAFWQLIIYIIFITILVFVLSVFTRELINANSYKETIATRARRAIDLALFHNSFPEQNRIQFVYSHETGGFPNKFVVGIKIDDKSYEIITDWEASVVERVFDTSESSK